MTATATQSQPLGWIGIVRLGLVQTALGAIVILTTSTMNRVMVVELGLAAVVPGFLVALHYVVQMSRPRWGYGSDLGGRRVPWIVGGIAALGLGAIGAAVSVVVMATMPYAGFALGVVAFVLVGGGAGAAGTSLLAFMATRVDETRRAPAATIVWMMMIAGFVLTATIAGKLLDPFTPARLVAVTASVAAIALVVSLLATLGLERAALPAVTATDDAPKPSFREALREVWGEATARRFSVFVFASMLAYSAQDLILEPYAGAIFDFTPGQSTQLSGTQHAGVLLGMIVVALAGRFRIGTLAQWTIGGCLASALALGAIVAGGRVGPGYPLSAAVFALGLSNGAFAVAAIGSMMGLAGRGKGRREGLRMGVWGAAQATAFGLGGFVGTAGVDLARLAGAGQAEAYMSVFALEALLFLVSARLAARVGDRPVEGPENRLVVAGEGSLLGLGGN